MKHEFRSFSVFSWCIAGVSILAVTFICSSVHDNCIPAMSKVAGWNFHFKCTAKDAKLNYLSLCRRLFKSFLTRFLAASWNVWSWNLGHFMKLSKASLKAFLFHYILYKLATSKTGLKRTKSAYKLNKKWRIVYFWIYESQSLNTSYFYSPQPTSTTPRA